RKVKFVGFPGSKSDRLLETDISRFYGSIYTHSIAWAVHTKAVAKVSRSRTLLGNNLDYLVRMGQDGQTVGIPIGPDTSLVIAELLMQRCDAELASKLPKLKGHRFIDDYELSFYTRTEAEEAFHILERVLRDYELALNPKKTRVVELPLQFEAPWVAELKAQSIRTSVPGQASDIEALINKAFHLHKVYPDEVILSYAIARLRTVAVHPDNWELFQRLLLLCITPEPATFPYAIELIIKWVNAGYGPLVPEISEVVNSIIVTHAPLAHSSEVSHALWASINLGLTLTPEAVSALSKADDSVVALMALDCESRGLMTTTLDKSLWSTYMTPSGLYEEHWLLSYEANIKGWLPTVGGGDHVAADANFNFLKSSGVYFYNSTPLGASPIPSPTLPTPTPVSTAHSP
ncbi:RNA-directed DNA polymerase, partial [Candidatus Thiothrix sp. Deng01]